MVLLVLAKLESIDDSGGSSLQTSQTKDEKQESKIVAAEAPGAVPLEKPKTFYDVLQVAVNASWYDIRKGYRKLLIRCHPDKPGGSDHAFKELELAYDTLSDATLRQLYDEKIGALPLFFAVTFFLGHVDTPRTVSWNPTAGFKVVG